MRQRLERPRTLRRVMPFGVVPDSEHQQANETRRSGRAVVMPMLALLVMACGLAALAPAHAMAAPVKIVLVGDSTTAQHTGWGGLFCGLRVQSIVSCLPLGRGGRTPQTYLADGSWELALAEASVTHYDARYILIQLGQNGAGSNAEAGSFSTILERFVTDAKRVGARPVLLTPLAPRRFRDGVLVNPMAEMSAEVRAVAEKTHVPLLDLNTATAALYTQMGADATATIARGNSTSKPDYVHLNRQGAELVSELVATALVEAVPSLSRYIRR